MRARSTLSQNGLSQNGWSPRLECRCVKDREEVWVSWCPTARLGNQHQQGCSCKAVSDSSAASPGSRSRRAAVAVRPPCQRFKWKQLQIRSVAKNSPADATRRSAARQERTERSGVADSKTSLLAAEEAGERTACRARHNTAATAEQLEQFETQGSLASRRPLVKVSSCAATYSGVIKGVYTAFKLQAARERPRYRLRAVLPATKLIRPS